MNQDITAPVAAHQAMLLNVVASALCDEVPMSTATTADIPYLGPALP
jgi:D-alanyl-D-alanine carboxypeptidase